MQDEGSVFGSTPEGLDRLVFEAWQHSDQEDRLRVGAGLERPGDHIDRYKLLSVLGEGGMGIVYLAEQERPVGRKVALKLIKPGMDSKRVLARFEAEQQALALMEHPHVAHVYDAGLAPSGRPYFVMECVNGIPITEHCDKYRFTIEERLQLFLPVCEAVQHAHQKGIIHRDIKPSNVLVSMEGGESVPKVIDFGIAKAITQPLTEQTLSTEQGQLVGTPEYMSPEQADPSNQDIDTRTDVYSLGVVLYELVAGLLPFDPDDLRQHGMDGARRIICNQDPQTPSTKLSRTSAETSTKSAHQRRTSVRQLQRRLRGDLDWITLKALEKDRTRRYPSAGDLAADVRRHLNHEPLTAGPPSLVYKAQKFVQRNRMLVTGLAAILAVLIAGIIVSLAFAIRARHARDEATIISQFLQEDVFNTFDAWDLGRQQITIGNFLDNASARVPDKFGDTPLQEASIRRTLGTLYQKVNRFEEAETHLRRSLDIFTRELGRNNTRTLEVVDQLGQIYWLRWEYFKAEQYLWESLQGKRRLLGTEHASTLQTMGWLAWAYYGAGRARQAELLLQEACETADRTLGARDPIAVESMLYYGSALLFRGRYGQGEHTLEEALRRSKGVLKPAHPFVVYASSLLGRQYSRTGRYRQAEELLNSALQVSRDAWGEHAGCTLHNVAALAENCASQGRLAEAEALLIDSTRRDSRKDESPNQIAAPGFLYLGLFYLSQKRYEEAEDWLNRALAASLKSHGDRHPFTAMSRIALGMVYREQGRYEEADRQLVGLEEFIPVRMDESIRTAEVMHQVAALRQEQGMYAEAGKLHLKALEIRRDQLAENHPHTLHTIRGLIALYTAWHNKEEARKWLAELEKAYAHESAKQAQKVPDEGSIRYDHASDMYTLTAHAASPWPTEKELNFSYPESSSEMWHVSDDVHFASKMLHGDGSLSAQIESIDPPQYSTQVALTFRDTLDPASRHVSVALTPLGDIIFQHRDIELAATQSHYAAARVALPHWIRLTRRDNIFTAHHSTDGANWEPIDPNESTSVDIPLNDTVNVGLTLTSDDTSRVAEARINHVMATGQVDLPGPFTESRDIRLELPPTPVGRASN